MSKPIKSEEFFEEPSDQSSVKAAIVSNYFKAWAKIILGVQVRYNKPRRIAYIDLFAGPGKYQDGSYSTPLLVIQQALQNEDIREALVCLFNDANENNIIALRQNLETMDGITSLKYSPDFYNIKIETGQIFENKNIIPTLLFADPWGYTGISLEMLGSILQSWGSECIFFFNYNRINAGLTNPFVTEQMNAIFGEKRADELRAILTPLSPKQREEKIINEMESALKEAGAKHVLAYPFRKGQGVSTSHHLIFATKNEKGHRIMKGIMAKLGVEIGSGVSELEFNRSKQIPFLFEDPIEKLSEALLQDFSGKTLKMIDVYIEHNQGKNYTVPNYKKALLLLEGKSLIIAKPSADERQQNTLGDNVTITFP